MARRTVLSADLRERHINMMSFAACIGFGLFLQSGVVIYLSGPGLAIVEFLLGGSILWAVVGCLGEMTSLFPVPGPLFEFPVRFLDESIGYATGWTAWFAWIVMQSGETLTATQLFRFRFDPQYLQSVGYPDQSLGWGTESVSPAVWTFIILVVAGLANLLPVRFYGELEYILGVVKIVFIVGLIVMNVMLSAIQLVPHGDHFWTWDGSHGFATNYYPLKVDSNLQPTEVLEGNAGRFVALWTSMTIVMFCLIGFETIAISSPENRDLDKYEAIKIASKKLTIRLTVLYVAATFAVGLNVPGDDINLAQARWNSITGGQNSIFLLAAVRNHLRGFPHLFNGMFIFSAITSGMNGVYNSSRLLHALACIPEAWPVWAHGWRKRLERTNDHGVPVATVSVSWLFGLLAFLSLTNDSALILGRIARNATVSEMIVYATICASYTRFYRCIKKAAEDPALENRSAFNRDDEQYPYRTHGQLFRAYYGLIFLLCLIILNGWYDFLHPFHTPDFIASYIGIAAFVVLTILYHIKLDGYDVRKWRFRPSMQIQRPPPKIVAPEKRRGKLRLPDRKRLLTVDNAKAYADWLWVWIK